MSGKNPGLIPAGLRQAGAPPAGTGGGGGGPIVAADITDASAAGRNVLKAATAALQRTALGLAAIASSGTSADITDATAAGRALLTAATDALQRTALGLAAIATSGASADITDATAAGRALLTAATAALQRTALGLAAIATSGASADITDATAAGRALLTAATVALQRTALGLAAIATSGASADITDSTAPGRALLTAATAALQRTALGLATVASSGLASDLSGTVALASGGTGQTTAIAAGDALHPMGASIAGAATTDLATATGPTVSITGTGASITSLGTVVAGAPRRLIFAAAGHALIHNATTLILPYAASIVVGAGDAFDFVSLGSGNWRCTGYQPAAAAAARTALGLVAMASSAIAANITDATTAGRALLTAANAAAQRTALGLAAIAASGLAADITDATTAGRALLTAATVAAQRTALALTELATAVISGNANGRFDVPERLDRQVLAAATTFTTASFTANAYKSIILKYKGERGPSDMLFRLKFNNDTGTNYVDIGLAVNSGTGNDMSPSGTNGYATIAQSFAASDAAVEWTFEIDPRTDGRYRTGRGRSVTLCIGVAGWQQQREQSLAWLDKTTDCTFFTIFASAGSMTGTFEMYGVRA